MKTIHINTMVLGTALILTGGAISQAGPSPDLMNSIHWLRLEAQKRANADAARFKPDSIGITCWSRSRTRNITAGQSSVAVPDLPHRVVGEGTPGDFQIAPLLQPNSTPETK